MHLQNCHKLGQKYSISHIHFNSVTFDMNYKKIITISLVNIFTVHQSGQIKYLYRQSQC